MCRMQLLGFPPQPGCLGISAGYVSHESAFVVYHTKQNDGNGPIEPRSRIRTCLEEIYDIFKKVN